MKLAMSLLLILACPLVVANAAAVTPVQKVLSLMSGMVEKGKKAKDAEAVQFSAYKQWCGDTIAEKKEDIEKLTTDAENLAVEINDLESLIVALRDDIKKANAVRAEDKANYDAMHKDYSESIDAIERAIAVLKKETA